MPDEQQPAQEVSTTKLVQGKTVLSFTKPTPLWATYFFRIEFILNKCLMMYYAGTSMHIENVKEKIFIMSVIDLGVWLFAKSIGVKKSDIGFDEEN